MTRETHQNEKRSSYTQHILSFCYHALVLVVVVAMDRFTCLGMDLLVVVKQVDYMRRSVGRLAPPFSTKKRRMSFVILHRNVNMCVECKSHDVYFRLLSNMNCHLIVEYVTVCPCIVWYLDCTVFQKKRFKTDGRVRSSSDFTRWHFVTEEMFGTNVTVRIFRDMKSTNPWLTTIFP